MPEFNDNGLTTLNTPTAGTGSLNATFNDDVAAAVNFNFSNLNGANDIEVNRGDAAPADVYTLGNFGTNNLVGADSQALTIEGAGGASTATINFGSGAYNISVPTHAGGAYSFVDTAPNGAGLANSNSVATWAQIVGALTGDTLTFQPDQVQNVSSFGAVANLATGIADALQTAAHTASEFNFGGNTYFFDHADASNAITAKDAMVEVAGVFNALTVDSNHVIHFA